MIPFQDLGMTKIGADNSSKILQEIMVSTPQSHIIGTHSQLIELSIVRYFITTLSLDQYLFYILFLLVC